MKFNIEGFSQRAALNLKKEIIKAGKKTILKLDCTDLILLRWFVDFFPRMKKYEYIYAWVNYQSIIEDLPLLQIAKVQIYRRFNKMVKLGILTHKHVKEGGSYSYYGFGPNYEQLIDDTPMIKMSDPYDKKVIPPMTKKFEGVEPKSSTKDSSTKLNNSITKIEKESIKEKEGPPHTSKGNTGENMYSYTALINSYTENQELRSELMEHLKVRRAKKGALTNRAIELSLKKLDSLASTDELKILIVQKAILKGWIAFYPLDPDEMPKRNTNLNNKHKPSYNIEEYENYSIFDDMEENQSPTDKLMGAIFTKPSKRR